MDPAATVETYYDAIDDGDYGRLESVLAPSFVHERPDRRLEGRDHFLEFMRETRPVRTTTHEIAGHFSPARADGGDVRAVRGEVVAADGETLVAFVDVFTLGAGRIERLRTYTG